MQYYVAIRIFLLKIESIYTCYERQNWSVTVVLKFSYTSAQFHFSVAKIIFTIIVIIFIIMKRYYEIEPLNRQRK